MVKREIVELLHHAGVDAKEEQIEKPDQSDYGDFAFPCFPLAKSWKKSPVDIAEEVSSRIKIPKGSIVKKVEALRGYVNFYLDYQKFASKVLKNVDKKISIGKGNKIMIDYSAPNPIHPIHIGHARSTFLGDALANVYDFLGYKTVRANLMNDVGLQAAKLVYSYMTWGEGQKPKGKPDFWLWQYYIKVHEEINKDELHEENSKHVLKAFEQNSDKEIVNTWNKVVKWCVEGFEQTYKRLGIDFDVYFYEHDFRDEGKKVIKEALDHGVAIKIEEGAVMADLEHYGLPNTILLRSDGTGLYITSDLGLTVHKFNNYKIGESIWVVASQQNLHFKQLFKIFELLGYSWYKNCKHFSYEMVKLPEGKMSSREGRAVLVDDVLDKLVNLAYTEVTKRNSQMKENEKWRIAEKIGVGAFKYSIVRIEPQNEITFDWNQMLSLEGNTGPYIQYAHTRCSSILKKSGKFKKVYTYKEMSREEEALVRKISTFDEVVKQSAVEMKPHLICNYMYDLATVFNSFYQKVPVLKSESENQKSFRLTLVESTKTILEKCLGLIGIEAVGKM